MNNRMSYFQVDVPCPSCGYNLRGLSLGRGCPECGLKITSLNLTADEKLTAEQLDAEVAKNLLQLEEEKDLRQQVTAFLAEWDARARRLDGMIARMEGILDRQEEQA